MGLKRYTANKDTTITNAFQPDLITRGTGSNMGEADTMEVFSIFGQASSGSRELARSLVQFPVDDISADRAAGDIPASGSVNFYIRLFNAKHSFTVPRKITLSIQAVSRSWDEGHGTDLDEYTDHGFVNWLTASSGSTGFTPWDTQGGDYHTASYIPGSTMPQYTAFLEDGHEDVVVDITSMVEEWVAGTQGNFGVGVFLTSSIENAVSSSYTKRFFTRGSEFFFKKPYIEARWDSSVQDDRGRFFASSSLACAEDNINHVFFYNFVRGRLKNLPPPIGTGSILVNVYTDPVTGSLLTLTAVTGGHVTTGIYSASFALNTTESCVYDRWFSGSTTYHTGTINVKRLIGSNINPDQRFVVAMPNLRPVYSNQDMPRFRVFTRQRDWCPTIYVVASKDIETEVLDDMYYRIVRVTDGLVAVDYGTGSENHTRLSYDVSGSYADLDLSILAPGYMYEMSFIFAVNGVFREFAEKFRFRIDAP